MVETYGGESNDRDKSISNCKLHLLIQHWLNNVTIPIVNLEKGPCIRRLAVL